MGILGSEALVFKNKNVDSTYSVYFCKHKMKSYHNFQCVWQARLREIKNKPFIIFPHYFICFLKVRLLWLWTKYKREAWYTFSSVFHFIGLDPKTAELKEHFDSEPLNMLPSNKVLKEDVFQEVHITGGHKIKWLYCFSHQFLPIVFILETMKPQRLGKRMYFRTIWELCCN